MESTEHSIRKILIPFDFSRDNTSVLNLGLQIAEQNNAILHLLHVVDSNLLGSGSAFSGKFFFHGATVLEKSQKHLQEMKQRIESESKVKVITESQIGNFTSAVLEYVPKEAIDLVLISVRVQKITNLFSYSKAYPVVIECDVPVMTVPESCKINQLRSVIYPVREVDGVISKLNSLIPVILNMRPTVYLFGVKSPANRRDSPTVGNAIQFLKKRMVRQKIDLGRIQSVTSNKPAQEILAQASKFTPDLLAVNVSTEQPLKRIFKRNFTEKIIFKSEVPVLFYHKAEPISGVQSYVQVPYPMYPV